MSELRELWQQVIMFDKREMSPRLYAVLEALVEAVEPEHTELAEANERLKVRRTMCHSWEGRCHKAERELAEAKAEIERLRPLTKNWQLVLGMPDGTGLQHTGRQYYAMRCCPGLGWRAIAASCVTNPAEALRSIQASE